MALHTDRLKFDIMHPQDNNSKMKEEDITTGVTAFIDILGFSNKVLNANSFDDIKEIYNGSIV